MRVASIITLFLLACSTSAYADQIRLRGGVQLWDKSRISEKDLEQLIDSDVSAQISLAPDHPSQLFWILDETEITPRSDGKWQTFGRYNGDEIERQIPMLGKVGNFFSPEPQLIPCKQNQGICGGILILRSPSNAAAWKFNLCLQGHNSGSTIPTAETISCLEKARRYSEKEVIKLQLADIYSKKQQYDACFASFDSVAQATTSDTIRESAIANASECLEQAALLERPQVEQYEKLSEYIRTAFKESEVTRTRTKIRQMLLRRWFDAFNIRLAPSGELELLISKITENNDLANELEEIYSFYFWSKSEPYLAGLTTKDRIKAEIKELAKQWNRYYQ